MSDPGSGRSSGASALNARTRSCQRGASGSGGASLAGRGAPGRVRPASGDGFGTESGSRTAASGRRTSPVSGSSTASSAGGGVAFPIRKTSDDGSGQPSTAAAKSRNAEAGEPAGGSPARKARRRSCPSMSRSFRMAPALTRAGAATTRPVGRTRRSQPRWARISGGRDGIRITRLLGSGSGPPGRSAPGGVIRFGNWRSIRPASTSGPRCRRVRVSWLIPTHSTRSAALRRSPESSSSRITSRTCSFRGRFRPLSARTAPATWNGSSSRERDSGARVAAGRSAAAAGGEDAACRGRGPRAGGGRARAGSLGGTGSRAGSPAGATAGGAVSTTGSSGREADFGADASAGPRADSGTAGAGRAGASSPRRSGRGSRRSGSSEACRRASRTASLRSLRRAFRTCRARRSFGGRSRSAWVSETARRRALPARPRRIPAGSRNGPPAARTIRAARPPGPSPGRSAGDPGPGS